MPYDHDTNAWWEDNEDIDEDTPELPLTEWRKKDLRAEVERLREREAELEESHRAQVRRAIDLHSYVLANQRHFEQLRRMQDEIFDRDGWRVADIRMEMFNAQTVEISTIRSFVTEHVPGAPPRAELTLTMYLCPKLPGGDQ